MSSHTDGWDELDRWATEAVKGANNWLVTIRNAVDEGYDPWSDRFTSHEQMSAGAETTGLMSYSEGLTALALTNEFAKDRDDWLQLQPEIYRNDVASVVDSIRVEDAGGDPAYVAADYSPEPYLPGETTTDFTDAVSFSTSALMGALQSGITLDGDDIDESDVEAALETNVQWFLNNDVDVEEGVAWAWVGSTDDQYDPTPENYFTYTAVIPLCDLLRESDNEHIQAIAADYEDEIREKLDGAKAFLLDRYWEDDRGCWGGPGYDAKAEMSTCYTLMALSYIHEYVDGSSLTADEQARASTAIDWFLQTIDGNIADIYQIREDYNCSGTKYTDGTGPYLFLDTMTEFLNFDIGDVDDTSYSRSEVETLRDDFARQVLDQCWAGNTGFKEKGFRHLGDPHNAKTAPKSNPTVIYTTQVGIETFLLNVLQGELAQGHRAASTGRAVGGGPTEQPAEAGEVVADAGSGEYFFGVKVGTAGLDGIGPAVEASLRELRSDLEEAFGDGDGATDEASQAAANGGQAAALSDVEALNQSYFKHQKTYKNDLGNVINDYVDVARDEIPKVFNETVKEAGNVNKRCVKDTMDTFDKLYFEDAPETFRGEIEEFLGLTRGELLQPWIAEFERLADLSDREITDPKARKRAIDESIEALRSIDPGSKSEAALEEMVTHMKNGESGD